MVCCAASGCCHSEFWNSFQTQRILLCPSEWFLPLQEILECFLYDDDDDDDDYDDDDDDDDDFDDNDDDDDVDFDGYECVL